MKWLDLDSNILRKLRFGAMTGEEIRIEIGKDQNIDPLRSPTLHRIPILGRYGYTQSKEYSTKEGEIKLHALTEIGVEELDDSGYAAEHIRTPHLPSKKYLKHERAVTKCCVSQRGIVSAITIPTISLMKWS